MFGRVRGDLERLAGRFDPALIDAHAAERILEDATAIKNIAAAIEAQAAARVAETSNPRSGGSRSAAEALAKRTKTSIKDAKRTLATGRRLKKLPATRKAAAQGKLSPAQTDAITDAADADPESEADLLDQAEQKSLQELRDECARAKARVTDQEARRREIHAERAVRNWVDRDGRAHLHLTDNAERIAAIAGRLETDAKRRLADQARAEREPLVAHMADALHDLVCHQHPDGQRANGGAAKRPLHPDVKIRVRVDLPVLLRGYVVGDQVCEIVGYGPVPVSVIQDLIDTADPFLAALATDGEQVLGVAHLGRRANEKQQTALEWLYPTCAVEGCGRSTYLENDHREEWATTHLTLLEWQDRVCSHHHDLKTHRGWGLVDGHGKRAFVPPDDHRHPRHRRRAQAPPAAA